MLRSRRKVKYVPVNRSSDQAFRSVKNQDRAKGKELHAKRKEHFRSEALCQCSVLSGPLKHFLLQNGLPRLIVFAFS